MDITYAITLTRAWIARREAKGEHPNADTIWARICAKWPRAEEWQRERVFQATA